MYGDWPIDPEDVDAILDRSLGPRNAASLFDTVASLGVDAGARVLDVGARDARYSVTLHERFGCDVMALEPVSANVEAAQRRVRAAGHTDHIEVVQGRVEAVPIPDETFDVIFCRDVLSHISELEATMRECYRVTAPGGHMVSYQTFATDRLEPKEAARLFPDLAVVPTSMDPKRFESESEAAGFSIAASDIVGSEWREAWEEDGTRTTSRQLLHVARLLREAEALKGALGEVAYRVELANAMWGVYQMIGKLEPRIYVLQKP